jgi:hypothetical protein
MLVYITHTKYTHRNKVSLDRVFLMVFDILMPRKRTIENCCGATAFLYYDGLAFPNLGPL